MASTSHVRADKSELLISHLDPPYHTCKISTVNPALVLKSKVTVFEDTENEVRVMV